MPTILLRRSSTSLNRLETSATLGAKSSRPGFIQPCKSNSLDEQFSVIALKIPQDLLAAQCTE